MTVYDPPVNTYVPLQTITLGSAAASVTFASISQDYRDLVLVSSVIHTVNTNHKMQLNGDTGSNYSFVQMFGNGSSPTSNIGTNNYFTPFINSNPNTDTSKPIMAITQIMDYSATDKHKTMIIRADAEATAFSPATSASAHRWANTSAVTSIYIFPVSGSLAANTTFSLFGIEA